MKPNNDEALHTRTLIIEDVELMTGSGEHPENILRRLAVGGHHFTDTDHLARMLYRWGHPTLARLVDREGVAA